MNWFKNLGIGTKLVLSIGIIMVVGLGILSTVIVDRVGDNVAKTAQELVLEDAKSMAGNVEGVMNEMIALNKAAKNLLERVFTTTARYNISAQTLDNIMVNTLDSSAYANYGFLYLKNPLGFESDGKFQRMNNGDYMAVWQDRDENSMGDVGNIPVNGNEDWMVLTNTLAAKVSDRAKVFLGQPSRFSLGGREFIGIGMGMPLFDSNNSLVGVVGFVFDFNEVAKIILETSSGLFEGSLPALIEADGTIMLSVWRTTGRQR